MFTVLVLVLVGLTGCRTGGGARSPTVSLPEVHLGGGEFIQEFKVRVKGGRVTALDRIPHDWDISLEWKMETASFCMVTPVTSARGWPVPTN
jgi:hypothetical protein